jgi:hypothetical protein
VLDDIGQVRLAVEHHREVPERFGSNSSEAPHRENRLPLTHVWSIPRVPDIPNRATLGGIAQRRGLIRSTLVARRLK